MSFFLSSSVFFLSSSFLLSSVVVSVDVSEVEVSSLVEVELDSLSLVEVDSEVEVSVSSLVVSFLPKTLSINSLSFSIFLSIFVNLSNCLFSTLFGSSSCSSVPRTISLNLFNPNFSAIALPILVLPNLPIHPAAVLPKPVVANLVSNLPPKNLPNPNNPLPAKPNNGPANGIIDMMLPISCIGKVTNPLSISNNPPVTFLAPDTTPPPTLPAPLAISSNALVDLSCSSILYFCLASTSTLFLLCTFTRLPCLSLVY